MSACTPRRICNCRDTEGASGGVIGDDTFATRRHLPHPQRDGKTYFLTFATRDRLVLPGKARTLALETITFEHRRAIGHYRASSGA